MERRNILKAKTKFNCTCISSIIIDIAFILSIVYKIFKYGNNNIGCLIASTIGFLVSVTISVQIIYKIELIKCLKRDESLREETQKIIVKAIIEVIVTILMLI